jgi:hypothetical protein
MSPQTISPQSAVKLIDLIEQQARLADSEHVKRVLLQAGLKIAELALRGETAKRARAA